VTDDGFFDQSMVKKLGFKNAVFFADRWHITDSSLRKTFGPVWYTMPKGHLCRMNDAGSVEQFEATLSSARGMLHSMPVKNGEAETNLTDFAGNRNSCVTECLCSPPGHYFRHGSVAAEIITPLCYATLMRNMLQQTYTARLHWYCAKAS
jgi:hypothetical protein